MIVKYLISSDIGADISIYIGVIVISILTIIGNIIESARKFSLHKSATLENPNNIKIFYECLNIHLSLSLGSIGLYWEQTSTSPKLIIFALIYF